MVNIKSEVATGKPLPLKERPLVGNEKLKQSLEQLANADQAKNLEQAGESLAAEIRLAENQAPAVLGPFGAVSAPQAEIQKRVETVLADGLADLYLSLVPEKGKEFKKAGEETAKKISQLLTKAKINIGEIIKLIKKWLSIIPGVNKYFLEKEAKIKADEIIKIKNENK